MYYICINIIQHSDEAVHVNTAESYVSMLKKGILGTFHHVSKKHLNRYIGEFDFRFNHRKIEDHKRLIQAVLGVENKRLLYSESDA
ncbi:transposase [candidate division KSB1 bacterium]